MTKTTKIYQNLHGTLGALSPQPLVVEQACNGVEVSARQEGDHRYCAVHRWLLLVAGSPASARLIRLLRRPPSAAPSATQGSQRTSKK